MNTHSQLHTQSLSQLWPHWWLMCDIIWSLFWGPQPLFHMVWPCVYECACVHVCVCVIYLWAQKSQIFFKKKCDHIFKYIVLFFYQELQSEKYAQNCVLDLYYSHLGVSARICTYVGMCETHVEVYMWVQVCVWSRACFLMCVSHHCSPLSSNSSSMPKPSVCPEIVRAREGIGHDTVCRASWFKAFFFRDNL